MIEIAIIVFCIACAILYAFIVPAILKNKDIEIPHNQFQEFVNNDSGYAWSRSADRIKQYKQRLNKDLKTNTKSIDK